MLKVDFKRLCYAVIDYKYLLNRGYPQNASLQLVSNRYQLDNVHYSILYRCVHGDREAYNIRLKLVNASEVKGNSLLIDGFNVLITVESGILNEPLFIGDDGLLRDVRKSYRRFKFQREFHEGIVELIVRYISKLNPKDVTIVLDQQISFSGELARIFNEKVEKFNINGHSYTAKKTDVELLKYVKNCIIASSDIVIVKRANKIFDLSRYIVECEKPKAIIDLIKYCIRCR